MSPFLHAWHRAKSAFGEPRSDASASACGSANTVTTSTTTVNPSETMTTTTTTFTYPQVVQAGPSIRRPPRAWLRARAWAPQPTLRYLSPTRSDANCTSAPADIHSDEYRRYERYQNQHYGFIRARAVHEALKYRSAVEGKDIWRQTRTFLSFVRCVLGRRPRVLVFGERNTPWAEDLVKSDPDVTICLASCVLVPHSQ